MQPALDHKSGLWRDGDRRMGVGQSIADTVLAMCLQASPVNLFAAVWKREIVACSTPESECYYFEIQ